MSRGHGRGFRPAEKGSLSLSAPDLSYYLGGTTKNPCQFYVPPDGLHCYVCYSNSGEIGQFSRNVTTGALTPLSTATTLASSTPYYLTGSADGKFVYAVSAGGNLVRQWSRNSTTGLLTQLSPFTLATAANPVHPVLAVSDAYLYVSNKIPGGVGSVSMFSRDSTTGKLTALAPATIAVGTVETQPQGMAVFGNSLYVGTFQGNQIFGFTIDPATGLLTAMSTPSFTAGTTAAWIVVSPDGKNVYVANDIGATGFSVSQFSRDLTTGLLTPLSPASVPAGNGPYSIAMTPDGLSLYVGDSDGQTISQYTRDATTGLLSPKNPPRVRSDPTITTVTGNLGPNPVYVAPGGKHLYASGKATTGHCLALFNIHT